MMIKRIQNNQENSKVQYWPEERPRFGDKLSRNLAIAAMLVLTLVSVRNSRLPSGKTLLTAVQDMTQMNWNDGLGKISFVGNFFPESISVFFESSVEQQLISPCFGDLSHAWSENEPYLSYANSQGKIYAMSDGQVMSIAHGNDEEKILRIRHENGVEVIYYNLAHLHVQEGDQVDEAVCIGGLMDGKEAVIDVRKNGLSVDASPWIIQRDGRAL